MAKKKVTVIADIGSNWRVGSDMESKKRASKLVQAAIKNGADVVKFQLFDAEKLWRDHTRANALKQYEIPLGWLSELKKETEGLGKEFLVTPFCLRAVDELEALNVHRYKVASTDITYIPLLKHIAATKKPVILSSMGGLIKTNELGDKYDASFDEVKDALSILRPDDTTKATVPSDNDFISDDYDTINYNDVVLLHCVSAYPTPIRSLNMNRIIDLGLKFFPLSTGLSSHLVEPAICGRVVDVGGTYIEVHFDLSDAKGVESGHSYKPKTLAELVSRMNEYLESSNCNCLQSFEDFDGRKNMRDPSDWLRPTLGEMELQ